jgi:hypothetical protein
MIYNFTARSSHPAAGTDKSSEQFKVFAMLRKQSLWMELDGQQIRQSAGGLRRQFHALNHSIFAHRGHAQRLCHARDGLMV